MNNGHNSYRPRSPDLSAYTPQPPRLSSYDETSGFPAGFPVTHRGSYDASPYFSPQTSKSSVSYFAQHPHAPVLQPYSQQVEVFTPQAQTANPESFWPLPKQQFAQPFINPPIINHPIPKLTMPRRRKSDEAGDDSTPEVVTTRVGRATKKRKPEATSELTVSTPAGQGPSQGIDVKTKFPVARIKRIMQADEDVGKVAQATPTAVSKALELFMITLVTKAAAEAKDRSSKRITAAHLKQAVIKDETLDFLQEIIEKVPDATEKRGRGRSDSEEPPAEDSGKKKRSAGAGRRKKADIDD